MSAPQNDAWDELARRINRAIADGKARAEKLYADQNPRLPARECLDVPAVRCARDPFTPTS